METALPYEEQRNCDIRRQQIARFEDINIAGFE